MQENPETLPDTGSYEKYSKHYNEDSFWSTPNPAPPN